MDSRKGKGTQPNPNRIQLNLIANQQFTIQFAKNINFSQFANQGFGFSQFANQQFANRQFEPEIESDEEHVPETQEEEVVPIPTRMKARSWSPVEEEALAKAYVNVSQGPYKDNHQTHNSFWKKVLGEFNSHLGKDSGRSHHQLNSKWKDLNAKVTCFAGIYNKKKSNMDSGTKDDDVLNAAHAEYLVKQKTKYAFNHFTAWEVLKNFPKWSAVMTFEKMEGSSSKRARTSESKARSFEAEFPIDLHDEKCDQNEQEPPTRPTPPPRRKGKNQVESTSTECEELMKVYCGVANAKLKLKEEVAKAKLKLKEEVAKAKIAREQEAVSFIQEQKRQLLEQQKQNDLEFILKPHDQYTGPLLNMVSFYQKREIAERWGWKI